jgi:hypothetical protein
VSVARDAGTGAVHGGGEVKVVALVPPDNMLFTLATICNLGGSYGIPAATFFSVSGPDISIPLTIQYAANAQMPQNSTQ